MSSTSTTSSEMSRATSEKSLGELTTMSGLRLMENCIDVPTSKNPTESPLEKKSSTVDLTIFFKTKLCPMKYKGGCPRGSHCFYAHTEAELRKLPNLSKTRMCPTVRKGETCQEEFSSCAFAHSVDELRHTDDVFKTKICHMWKKGKCADGIDCRHAHGTDELTKFRRHAKVSNGNIKSGITPPPPPLNPILLQLEESPDRFSETESIKLIGDDEYKIHQFSSNFSYGQFSTMDSFHHNQSTYLDDSLSSQYQMGDDVSPPCQTSSDYSRLLSNRLSTKSECSSIYPSPHYTTTTSTPVLLPSSDMTDKSSLLPSPILGAAHPHQHGRRSHRQNGEELAILRKRVEEILHYIESLELASFIDDILCDDAEGIDDCTLPSGRCLHEPSTHRHTGNTATQQAENYSSVSTNSAKVLKSLTQLNGDMDPNLAQQQHRQIDQQSATYTVDDAVLKKPNAMVTNVETTALEERLLSAVAENCQKSSAFLEMINQRFAGISKPLKTFHS